MNNNENQNKRNIIRMQTNAKKASKHNKKQKHKQQKKKNHKPTNKRPHIKQNTNKIINNTNQRTKTHKQS